MGNINKAVDFMVTIANDDTHGYDQTKRNSPDYDCSSLVATALNESGFDVSPYSWTGNLVPQLLKCGFTEIKNNSKRKKGDIFITPNKHVVMCTDELNIVHASSNELGKAKGGKTGDQTGKEICVRKYYTPKYGWAHHLRYKNEAHKDKTIVDIAKEVIRGIWGDGEERKEKLKNAGYNYEEVQSIVNYFCYGEITENDFKVARNVMLGKYGVGITRKQKLKKEGYDYNKIQTIVNFMMHER